MMTKKENTMNNETLESYGARVLQKDDENTMNNDEYDYGHNIPIIQTNEYGETI